MKKYYGFLVRTHTWLCDDSARACCGHDCGWSAEHVGHQGPDNWFTCRRDAERQLARLARVLGVPRCDVAVVEVSPEDVMAASEVSP